MGSRFSERFNIRSATMVIELHPQSEPPSQATGTSMHSSSINQSLETSFHRPLDDRDPPSTATSSPQRWNHPKRNLWRFLGANYSFTILGINDAAYGECYTCINH